MHPADHHTHQSHWVPPSPYESRLFQQPLQIQYPAKSLGTASPNPVTFQYPAKSRGISIAPTQYQINAWPMPHTQPHPPQPLCTAIPLRMPPYHHPLNIRQSRWASPCRIFPPQPPLVPHKIDQSLGITHPRICPGSTPKTKGARPSGSGRTCKRHSGSKFRERYPAAKRQLDVYFLIVIPIELAL